MAYDLDDYNEITDAIAATIMGFVGHTDTPCLWDDLECQEVAERIAKEVGLTIE